jgi:hypothetical protein
MKSQRRRRNFILAITGQTMAKRKQSKPLPKSRLIFSSTIRSLCHSLCHSSSGAKSYLAQVSRIKITSGRNPIDGLYRLFVVVAPSARATLGTRLLAELRERLIKLGARKAWVLEYDADPRFISYLEQLGFVKVASFDLEGTPVVELSIDAPFQSLAPQT